MNNRKILLDTLTYSQKKARLDWGGFEFKLVAEKQTFSEKAPISSFSEKVPALCRLDEKMEMSSFGLKKLTDKKTQAVAANWRHFRGYDRI